MADPLTVRSGANATEGLVVDVLMITFNAPGYVKLSLPRLLDSCDEQTRIWLWHNGTHEETLEVTKGFASDPRVHRFHHSIENVRLTDPTNWMWAESNGAFLSKVDDDCLLPVDWIKRLRHAHEGNDEFGAIGASRLREEDIIPEAFEKKLQNFGPGLDLFRNHWVQGSGYLLKRKWVDKHGLLKPDQSWTNYCLELALDGAINGFLYPLIFEDHMDDPRSEHTLLHTDDDFRWRMPLSAKRSKVQTLDDWGRRMRRSAREVQEASLDLRSWVGWRRRLHNLRSRIDQLRRA